MTTAKELLKLIETVDPNDAEKLDEIDEFVMLYLFPNLEFWKIGDEYLCNGNKVQRESYTRSRDALKAIRPDGYRFMMEQFSGYKCTLRPDEHDWSPNPDNYETLWEHPESITGKGKTEELAELHAIIHAIAHERGEEI